MATRRSVLWPDLEIARIGEKVGDHFLGPSCVPGNFIRLTPIDAQVGEPMGGPCLWLFLVIFWLRFRPIFGHFLASFGLLVPSMGRVYPMRSLLARSQLDWLRLRPVYDHFLKKVGGRTLLCFRKFRRTDANRRQLKRIPEICLGS